MCESMPVNLYPPSLYLSTPVFPDVHPNLISVFVQYISFNYLASSLQFSSLKCLLFSSVLNYLSSRAFRNEAKPSYAF